MRPRSVPAGRTRGARSVLRRAAGSVLAAGATVSLLAVSGGPRPPAGSAPQAGDGPAGAGSPSGAVRRAVAGRTPRADTTVVGMTNALDFSPAKVTIRQGGTVVWKNTSVLVHTVTAVEDSAADPAHVRLPEGAEPFGSGRLAPDATYRHTFTVPGTYRYVCLPHEAAGMTGTVVVAEH